MPIAVMWGLAAIPMAASAGLLCAASFFFATLLIGCAIKVVMRLMTLCRKDHV